MTVRERADQDRDWIASAMSLAYPVEWTERALERKLAGETGVVRVDRENRVYCALEAYELPHPVFDRPAREGGPVIPAGLAVQVKDLVPQHHDQRWIDEVMCPVLAVCCREVERDNPRALDTPLWAFVAFDLAIPYWRDSIVQAEVVRSRGGDRALAYVPTLRRAIELLEAAGL